MARNNVLVVDDEPKMQRILEIMLNDMGMDAVRADNGQAALSVIEHEPVDLIITDLRMPVMDGIELIRVLREKQLLIPIIVITAHGTIKSAVDAMKLGACDYILRPFEVATVELAVKRALTLSQVQRENAYLRDEVLHGWDEFIGNNPVMQKLYHVIEQVSPSNLPVMIVGETGTGKELVARSIHKLSNRRGLFVAVNCAAIPESILESELFGHVRGAFTGAVAERSGKFEISDGGTLFLDEIAEMPAELQTRLLRVLQENYIERLGSNRRVDLDLRVITATNRDPRSAIEDQALREDLFYRLDGFRIDVPPLRDRGDDIILLARHFLQNHARNMGRGTPGISTGAEACLLQYHWPGNVRELENLMGRVLIMSSGNDISEIIAAELTGDVSARPGESPHDIHDLRLQPRIDELERTLIEAAVQQSGGNKAAAARLLEVSERTLWYKVKKLGLK